VRNTRKWPHGQNAKEAGKKGGKCESDFLAATDMYDEKAKQIGKKSKKFFIFLSQTPKFFSQGTQGTRLYVCNWTSANKKRISRDTFQAVVPAVHTFISRLVRLCFYKRFFTARPVKGAHLE